MHFFFNCLAATAGGGPTYVRNIVPLLSGRQDIRSTVLLSENWRTELGNSPNVLFLKVDRSSSARRFWLEQTWLRRLLRETGADVLISTGNFAMWKSPVPQVLLSGNCLYTSADFTQDLGARKDWRLWLDTRVKGFFARQSAQWADCTIAPSRAFAEELGRWTGRRALGVHHGFDLSTFFRDQTGLPADVQQKIDAEQKGLRLLFVSHYNYYRNFETLFRAIALLRERLPQRSVKLFLTCELRDGKNPGAFRTQVAAELVRKLGISQQVVELGTIPYHLLHHLYRQCDIYVTAAYAETFAHPLVEAMASGLPLVASDLLAHREICRDVALYFPRFSDVQLADQIALLANSEQLRFEKSQLGRQRAKHFSWQRHLDDLIAVSRQLVEAPTAHDPAVPFLSYGSRAVGR